jgi:hypothetical protein
MGRRHFDLPTRPGARSNSIEVRSSNNAAKNNRKLLILVGLLRLHLFSGREEMDSMHEGFVPSESILMFKAQALSRSRASVGKRGAPLLAATKVSPDDESLAPIIALYEKHEGDIEKIFLELGDHPGKALKYPPSDAKEFAVKVECH